MNRGLCLFLAGVLPLAVLGCVYPLELAERDRAAVQVGMTPDEVLALIGKPEVRRITNDGATWTFSYSYGAGIGWWISVTLTGIVLVPTILVVEVFGGINNNLSRNLQNAWSGRLGRFKVHFDADGRVESVSPLEIRR